MLTCVRGAVPGSKNLPELAHAWQGSVSTHRLPVLCSANASGGQATATIHSPGFGPGVHSSCLSPRANTFCTHTHRNTHKYTAMHVGQMCHIGGNVAAGSGFKYHPVSLEIKHVCTKRCTLRQQRYHQPCI